MITKDKIRLLTAILAIMIYLPGLIAAYEVLLGLSLSTNQISALIALMFFGTILLVPMMMLSAWMEDERSKRL